MDGISRLRNSIFKEENISEEIELYYSFLLETPNLRNVTSFYNLILLVPKNPRINEITKVLDLIRFPLKKTFKEV